MDPVGSWSAYAASYNRLASAPGFQNASNDYHTAMGGGMQVTPPSSQFLPTHAAPGTTPSPYTSTGFLPPSPAGYDSVFTPIFHQKAHYGIQHRPIKQSDTDPQQNTSSNYYDQNNAASLAWSQNSPQLPSPFGVLPHESVIPTHGTNPKTYENFNTHYTPSLNAISDYRNSSFIDPKKGPISPNKSFQPSMSFYQQMLPSTNHNAFYRQNDYYVKGFQSGQIPQASNISSQIDGKDYRLPEPPRPPYQRLKSDNCKPLPPKQPNVHKTSLKPYELDKPPEFESQSSPISFAMMDAQRGFQSTKSRSQQFLHIQNQQSYRFPMTPESDYQRSKSTESFGSTSSNPDCTTGIPQRPSPLHTQPSPSGHAHSPVYPMYNSPLTTISSPSPGQPDTFFNKQQPETPIPLDVTAQGGPVLNSVITRLDNRYERQDYNRPQWDEKQQKYPGFDLQSIQNRHQYYDPSHQVTLQDLSSCRGDPMSLVKTLQLQPERDIDENQKRYRKNPEKLVDSEYISKAPPPAHINGNQSNQNSYLDLDRWNLAPPPAKVLSTSPNSFNSQSNDESYPSKQPQSLMIPHSSPPPPYLMPFHLPVTQASEPLTHTASPLAEATNSIPEAATTLPPATSPLHAAASSLPEAASSLSGTASALPMSASSLPEVIPTLPEVGPPLSKATSPLPMAVPTLPEAASPLPEAVPLPEAAPSTSPSQEPEESQTKVIVPKIEEELQCLLNTNLNKDVVPPQNIHRINRNSGFLASFEKFIHGEKEPSPQPSNKPVKKLLNPNMYSVPEQNNGPVLNVPDFPSDPQDDPRYFPLPKSTDQRKFNSSDSEESDNDLPNDPVSGSQFGNLPPATISENQPQSTTEETSALNNTKGDTNPSSFHTTKRKNREPPEIVVPRRELAKRKAKEKLSPLLDDDGECEITVQPLDDSDLDPAWNPDPVEEVHTVKKSKRKSNKIFDVIIDGSSDEDNTPHKRHRKKFKKKLPSSHKASEKMALPQIIFPSKPSSSRSNNFHFKIGEFILIKADNHLRHPPIWRITEKTMLQKYLHFFKNGQSLYKSIVFFTGWSPENKNKYQGLTVKVVSQVKQDLFVKLLSEDIMIIENKDFIEDYMKLLQEHKEPFEVYVQTLCSKALDSEFLIEIYDDRDDYFLSNTNIIDKIVSDLERRVINCLHWSSEMVEAVQSHPTYTCFQKRGVNCPCGEPGFQSITFSGGPYDKDTLQIKQLDDPDAAKKPWEVILCRNCLSHVEIVYKLSHFKYYLYWICEDKVNEAKESDPAKDSHEILNECITDNVWHTQLYKKVTKDWGIAEALTLKLKDKECVT